MTINLFSIISSVLCHTFAYLNALLHPTRSHLLQYGVMVLGLNGYKGKGYLKVIEKCILQTSILFKSRVPFFYRKKGKNTFLPT